jgi:RNA polymerase sigma factor FliA
MMDTSALERKSQAPDREDGLGVVSHSPLVKRIAHHLISRLPPSVQVDDLVQAGMIGLLEAARNYDPTQGASFETYAGIRIRGAMLD